jgi:hypothetical protein
MHTYIHINTRIYIYIYIHCAQAYPREICKGSRIRWSGVQAVICIYTYIYMQTHMHIYMCVYTRTHIYIHCAQAYPREICKGSRIRWSGCAGSAGSGEKCLFDYSDKLDDISRSFGPQQCRLVFVCMYVYMYICRCEFILCSVGRVVICTCVSMFACKCIDLGLFCAGQCRLVFVHVCMYVCT